MTELTTEQTAPPTITDRLRQIFRWPLQQAARGCIKLGISPNAVTIAGLLLVVAPTILAGIGKFGAAGLVYMLCTPFDALDGAIARESGKTTRFGALLDSTLDRYGEALLLGGIAYRMAHTGNELGVVLAFAALFGSIMVSYSRARSEGLTIDNKIGLMTRVERTIITILGLLTGYVIIALWILAILTQVTVVQRFWRVYHATKGDGK